MNWKHKVTLNHIVLQGLFFLLPLGLMVKTAQAQSLLWEIKGNGLEQSSYLFGTMHSKDAQILAKGQRVLPYITKSEAFAMEIELDESMYGDIFSMVVTEGDYQLRNYLTDEQYGKLSAWFKDNYGMKLGFFEKIKPIFLYIMMTEGGMGADQPFMDQYFYNHAKEQEKVIIGLETLDEQIAALDVLSIEEQMELLIEGIEDPNQGSKDLDKMMKFYEKEKLDKMMKMIKKGSVTDEFYKVLITNRNINMADKIAHQIQLQPTFTAIGAGHLPTDEGVVELLRQKGYTLTPVDYE